MAKEVEVEIRVEAPPSEVFRVARHMEEFPQFMPDVESVKVVERMDNQTVTEWTAYIDEDTPISWRELDTFDGENFVIKYELIEGDLDVFQGEWRFLPSEGGTVIRLSVVYDFGMPAFERIIGPVLGKKVRDNCQMMLASIKKKVEGEK